MEDKKLLTPQEKQAWFERYNAGVHREGRIWTLVCLLALMAVPFAMGLDAGSEPVSARLFERGDHLLSHERD